MKYVFSASIFALLAACAEQPATPFVHAVVETAPVKSSGDAADDPAVWVNEINPSESLILGTDKRSGLYAYNLAGEVLQFLPSGELNNIDLRQHVVINGWAGDIAAASNRTNNSVTLFSIKGGVIEETGSFPSVLDEPYGLCLGAWDGGVFAFVAHKTGDFIAYRLSGPGGGAEVARLKLETQLEGCVFDDDTGIVYIGEEARGVWKTGFDGAAFEEPTLIDEVAGASGVEADVEGLALYKTGEETGYLLASSQGNNSYAVYRREGDNEFVVRFSIEPGDAIDGSEETDGIEAIAVDLGPQFPQGLFVAQDGYNAPNGDPQNFKIVDWREINALIEAGSQ